jgi:hypothetical protein
VAFDKRVKVIVEKGPKKVKREFVFENDSPPRNSNHVCMVCPQQ